MRKVEHVYPSGMCQEIEVEDSLMNLLEELKAHQKAEEFEGSQHGTNCACMDNLIRRIRNFIKVETPEDLQDRMVYIFREVARSYYYG